LDQNTSLVVIKLPVYIVISLHWVNILKLYLIIFRKRSKLVNIFVFIYCLDCKNLSKLHFGSVSKNFCKW